MIKKIGNIPRNVPKSVLVPKHQTVSGFYTIADCVKMQILSFFFFLLSTQGVRVPNGSHSQSEKSNL